VHKVCALLCYFPHKRMERRWSRVRVLRLRNILRLHKTKLFNFITAERAHCQMRGGNCCCCCEKIFFAAHSVDGAHVCHSSQSMGQQLSSGLQLLLQTPFLFFIIHSFIEAQERTKKITACSTVVHTVNAYFIS